MSEATEESRLPQSVRHKQILDVADEYPDASMSELAAEVPSATTELVERVLEEYGDPAQPSGEESSAAATTANDTATDDQDGTPAETTQTQSSDGAYPSQSDLTIKEVETLRVIAENPDVTQRAIADMLDVSPSTVSTRLNKITGFDWSSRQEFVETVLDPTDTQEGAMKSNNTELHATVEQLEDRLTAIEQELSASDRESERPAFDDPELAHKVIHACMDSDAISEDEELRILESIVR